MPTNRRHFYYGVYEVMAYNQPDDKLSEAHYLLNKLHTAFEYATGSSIGKPSINNA